MTLEFHRQIFEKSSNIKFHENPFNGSRFVPCGLRDGWNDGQTDANDEGNSRSFFCSFAKAPKYSPWVKCTATGR